MTLFLFFFLFYFLCKKKEEEKSRCLGEKRSYTITFTPYFRFQAPPGPSRGHDRAPGQALDEPIDDPLEP